MDVLRLSLLLLPLLLLQVGIVHGSNHGAFLGKRLVARRGGGGGGGGGEGILPEQETRRSGYHHLAYLGKPHHQQKRTDDEPGVVTAFLHTGDSSTLAHANCSRRFELTSLRGSSESMGSVLDTVLHATNFLNMILQANRSREQSLRRDIEWYHALVRSILEGDDKIQRAVVTFNVDSSVVGPDVLLQATRAGGEIVLQDLSGEAHRHLRNRSAETEWYHGVKDRKKKPTFHKRVLSQDFTSVDNSLKRGESYIPDKTHVKWSAPYLECENGNFVPRWLLTLSAGFYGLKSNQAPQFRGVVRVDINLQDVDIDQCSSDGWFAGTHTCNLTTTECLPMRGYGFVLDKYQCQCKKGFYHPSRVAVNSFESNGPNADEGWSSDCLPCAPGCTFCKDDTPCVTREDGALRLTVLAFQCLCMLLLFISMVIIYHYRRNKSIRASGLVLLEAILCGALLLYFPVDILYFQPSVFRCILLRWVRLLGFATVYGTLTLKLYRVLKVFLSRTAQRIPYMTSWRVLRLLAIILLVVLWFLVAWTSAVCQSPERRWALIDTGYTPEGLQFSMCLLDRWDYMMAVAEFLFLLWAVYLCYAVRTVPSAFHEPRYMAIAVHNELVLSAIFHVIRFTLAPELHPDWMLLLFFTHTHLTVTVTLGLLLIPKFLFAGTHMRDDIASEAYEDELDMGRSGSYLNSSITSAWSEHSLDPEDIREELKKLYSQLEIYKRKKMLANNPHLQKKRSSKKGLGRSLMRRITEIPESVHRQCSREDKDSGEHGSNRNSICMLKKNPFDPTHTVKPVKEETIKNNVFSLKKSHSSYDHVRDQSEESNSSVTDKMEVTTAEGSLLETLMGKKLVKRKSNENVNVPSESTESVPLVCKSASAHNLTADKKPIHPRPSMLQKSLSVIASAKEKTLGLTGKIQSSEDSNKKSQPKSKDLKSSMETDIEHKMVSQSTEVNPSVPKSCMAKPQVSSSQPVMCPDPVKAKELYDLSEVCPWEVEEVHTPSENRVQKHVSIAPKETTTVHGGAVKAGKTQQQKKKGSDALPNVGVTKETQRTSAVRADICPWEDTSESSQLTKQQGPAQTTGQLLTTESSVTKRADVCPWDFDDAQKTSDRVSSTDAMKKLKGTSPVEAKGKSALCEPSKLAGSFQLPTSKVDVCPWDYDTNAISPKSERTPSPLRSKESPSRKMGNLAPRTVEKSKDNDEEKGRLKAQDKLRSTEKHAISQQKMAEVCPWEVESEEVPLVEKRRSTNLGAAKAKAEVCPWEFEDASQNTGRDRSSTGVRQSTPSPSAAKKSEVCPWDFDDSTATKKA
uniref:G-protein coupled receptors family 3 profile domain-containing protein n=1 Tax=Periophthalmus magnuspinnatus TaxID=409849 RepID=A0A3B3ZV47_9GOBI